MPTKPKTDKPGTEKLEFEISDIPLKEIDLTATDLQMRDDSAGDGDQVDNLVEAYKAGDDVPPIVLFAADKSGTYYIGDGWTRCYAIKKVRGKNTINAKVYSGGRDAAFKHACGANANHGLRRTNADKRKAVTSALKKWPEMSDRSIADICKVGNQMVGHVRKEVCDSHTSTRKGKDGKAYPTPKKKSEQIDFWQVFTDDFNGHLTEMEVSWTNPVFQEEVVKDPEKAADQLETIANAIADEAREMRNLAKKIRSGKADKRTGGSV
ncbi:MAG: hypothetical protein AAGJ81_01535 [Verrucomicrobiota bacterium]